LYPADLTKATLSDVDGNAYIENVDDVAKCPVDGTAYGVDAAKGDVSCTSTKHAH